MALVYLWVEEYRNIKKQGFNFSPRFKCHYDETTNELTINENREYVSIFPENINVTAIVGENGSGKSSVLEVINNNEFAFVLFMCKNRFILYDYKSPPQKLKVSIDKIFQLQVNIENFTMAGNQFIIKSLKETIIAKHNSQKCTFVYSKYLNGIQKILYGVDIFNSSNILTEIYQSEQSINEIEDIIEHSLLFNGIILYEDIGKQKIFQKILDVDQTSTVFNYNPTKFSFEINKIVNEDRYPEFINNEIRRYLNLESDFDNPITNEFLYLTFPTLN
jgi:ABC-type dipeptide/oligopeptide/nickel transport system ATPase subunit